MNNSLTPQQLAEETAQWIWLSLGACLGVSILLILAVAVVVVAVMGNARRK